MSLSNEECKFSNYLAKLHIVDFTCTSHSGIALFDPQRESVHFLKKWLLYRNVKLPTNLSKIYEIATLDVQKPGKPLNGFFAFQAEDVSLLFCQVWLSYFGITGDVSKPITWWRSKVSKILKLSSKTSIKQSLLTKIKLVLELQDKRKKQIKIIEQCNKQIFESLSSSQWECLETESRSTIFTKLSKHLKNNMFVKYLLSVALDSSAIFVPLVVTYSKLLMSSSSPSSSSSKTIKEKVKHEVPALVGKTIALTAFEQSDYANAIIKDINSGTVFPFAITQEVAKKYLSAFPKTLQTITGLVVPSLVNILVK